MTYNNPAGGIGYAAEFQSSALPFVTSTVAPVSGSPMRIDFPKVTRFILVANLSTSSEDMSVGFTRAGVVSTNNKFIIQSTGLNQLYLEVRVKELWIQGEGGGTPQFSLCAGLTNIDRTQMPLLTGTLPDGNPGWTGVG